jgi:hypothetical protein
MYKQNQTGQLFNIRKLFWEALGLAHFELQYRREKRPILFLLSSKILTPRPFLRPGSLSSPHNKGGGYTLARRRKGGGGVNILEDIGLASCNDLSTFSTNQQKQCCGYGMFIPDPDFYPSRIQKQQQKRGVKCIRKKILVNFQRIIELFPKKWVIKLSKIWVWNPGSRINLFPIPDPGVKKKPDPASQTLIFLSIIENQRIEYTTDHVSNIPLIEQSLIKKADITVQTS